MIETGNQNTSSDFLRVLMALKKNTMKDLNVAEVCKVTRIENEQYVVEPINNTGQKWYCAKLQNLQIEVNNIVLVLFTNTDFRLNLKRIKNNQITQNTNDKDLHTTNNGVIIGIIYKKEEE